MSYKCAQGTRAAQGAEDVGGVPMGMPWGWEGVKAGFQGRWRFKKDSDMSREEGRTMRKPDSVWEGPVACTCWKGHWTLRVQATQHCWASNSIGGREG